MNSLMEYQSGAPEVGAHVINVGSTDTDWYIVPLCKKHNKEDEAFEAYARQSQRL